MAAKAAVGHTLGGCVLVETVASILALEHREIPGITRCDDLDPTLPLGKQRSKTLSDRGVLLKCTNGFAGQNSAIVLRPLSPADR